MMFPFTKNTKNKNIFLLSVIEWQSPKHEKVYGSRFKNVKTYGWNVHPTLVTLANKMDDAAQRDIYQFGVYTGGSMFSMHRKIKRYNTMWGFDSFQGLPQEEKGLQIEGKHWLPGGFSSKGALKADTPEDAMNRVKKYLNNSRVRLVMGFFNETLPAVSLSETRKALIADIDSDLYISAKQALHWLFYNNIATLGTLVRYDDWNRNVTWGESKAHAEITQECRIKWKVVSGNSFQVESAETCVESPRR